MASAFGQGGGHRAERLESEILMAHQPLGQYELSCRVPPPGPGVQRYLARRPSLWRWRWRTKGGGEVEGRASDGTGGWARTPAKWWRCSPPPRRGPRAPLFIPRPSHQRHRSSFHRRSSSSSSCRSQLSSSSQAGQDVVADVRRRAPHVRDRGPPPHLRRHHRPRRHRLGPEHRIPAGERAPLLVRSFLIRSRSCVGPPYG